MFWPLSHILIDGFNDGAILYLPLCTTRPIRGSMQSSARFFVVCEAFNADHI